MKTKEAFTWARSCSCLPPEHAKVEIPAGAPVHYNKQNDAYYVDASFFKEDSIVRHDATYYGCNVKPENVVLE